MGEKRPDPVNRGKWSAYTDKARSLNLFITSQAWIGAIKLLDSSQTCFDDATHDRNSESSALTASAVKH